MELTRRDDVNEQYKAGVVGDDITGCQDIGIFFTKQGLKSIVTSDIHEVLNHESDVMIIDTDSRFETYDTAYQRVSKATEALLNAGCTQYFKKTCSVFRGNIGAEFDAMLDTLHESLMIVIAAFPANGRTTIHGMHAVYGKALEDSQFKYDPMNPMTTSDLAAIIHQQSIRPVHHLMLETLRQGKSAVIKCMDQARKKGGYLLCDCENQNDLELLASYIKDEKVIGGSSAIAEKLAEYHKVKRNDTQHYEIKNKNLGIILAAGSITAQTQQQVRYAASHGIIHLTFDPIKLYDANSGKKVLDECYEKAFTAVMNGRHVLIQPECSEDKVNEMKKTGIQKGYDEKSVSRLISASLAKLLLRLIESTHQHRLCIAGGDTSARIMEMLQINTAELIDEIQTGICSSISLNEPKMLMILKSGSFGNEQFLCDAVKYLMNY